MSQQSTCLGSFFSTAKKSSVPGMLVAENAISPEEEHALLQAIDSSREKWTRRRTRVTKNYGPYYLYHERDTEQGRFRYTDGRVLHNPLPPFLYDTLLPIVRKAFPSLLAFEPNQVHVALYQQNSDGRIRMHNDNKMGEIGPYIVGLCLLSDCSMTFVRPRDNRKRVLRLPRYAVYVMSGEAHTEWRHGILSGATPKDRVSITLRDVRKLAVEDGAKMKKSSHMPTEESIENQRAKDLMRQQGLKEQHEDISLSALLS